MQSPQAPHPTLLLWRPIGAHLAGEEASVAALIVRHGGAYAETVDGGAAGIFASAQEAAATALALRRDARPESAGPVAVALHSGACGQVGGIAFGSVLKRAEAILRAASPGQILCSEATASLLAAELCPPAQPVPCGSHRLLDLLAPETLFEMCEPGETASGTVRSLDQHLHNLPLQPTPFIGRAREVAEVCERLRQGSARLLTLVATSGSGKTRFSLEIAVQMLDCCPDGVYFVALAPVTDPQVVVGQIARVLGVQEKTNRALIEQITEQIGDREMLLILDNFEQVLAAADIVGDLLSGTTRLRIIVTSHVPLRVPHEAVQYVPPLDLPNPERACSPLELVRYDAVGLFIERAQAVDGGFTLTEANAALVAAIVARLGGLPLAIDLAAACVDTIALPELLDDLGDYKQSSIALPAMLSWAYEKLPRPTRQAFARLGVFAGGCTLDIAEQICRVGNERLDVVRELQLLMRRNLIFPEELRGGVVRYIMLDCVHDLARMHLVGQEEVEVLAKRHSAFYVELARQGYAGLHGEQQAEWLQRIESEGHNMRQAFRWSLSSFGYETAGQFVAALGRYWHLSGSFSEGQRWVDAILPHCSRVSAPVQAQLLNVATVIYGEQGYYDRAAGAVQQALDLHRSLGNHEGVYHALNNLGVLSAIQGDFQRAADYYVQSLQLARTTGQARLHALALNNLGDLALEQGDYVTASAYLVEALELARQAGDQVRAIDLYSSLGWVALALYETERAGELFWQALCLCRAVRSDEALPALLEGAAGTVPGETAARLLGAAQALREATNRPLACVYEARVRDLTAHVQAQAGPAAFAQAWAHGRAMTPAQAQELAIVALRPGRPSRRPGLVAG